MTEDEQGAVFARFEAFSAGVAERGGTIVAGEALERPETARTLRDGVVTDGPYAETVEQIGAVFVVDLPTIDDVLDAARVLPSSYAIEVRPAVTG
jgi:hypothetical protein